ncbi:MAG: ATP-binding protein, partial [Thermomicrobiales bacterium]
LGTSVLQPPSDFPGSFATSAWDLADLPLPPSLREGLHALAAGAGAGERVILGGSAGYGQREIAASLASRWGCSLLAIDSSLLSAERSLARQQLETMARTARLTRSAIFIDGPWDTEHVPTPLVAVIAEVTDRLPLPVLIASSVLPASVSGIRLEVPAPDVAARAAWWNLALEDVTHRVDADTVAGLSRRYQLRPSHILDAVASAHAQARWHLRTEILGEDLIDAAQAQASLHLDRLAQKRTTTSAWNWEDLVLPADQMAQLREIHNHAQLRHLLHDHWKTPHLRHAAPGINVLFSGPSGTGKTMAAEVLAGALGLDLYTIDVPNTISKYVGEMEKNIDRIFRAAFEGNVVLFFDEADAWFGKRSQVREANDRYANVEVSYLLQRIESHDGVVILGTNLRSNMDDAFTRRLHHVVEFPFPDSALRERLWRKHLAGTGALDADVDPRFLATQFEIAGGSIRAITTNAAFLAAADDEAITMHHLVRATRREFQKLGRVCDATTFGRAIDYLEPADSREVAS